MSPSIRTPHSIVLLVGREDHSAPDSFGGASCVATADCVAVATVSPVDGPTSVSVAPSADEARLVVLGEFTIESEGQVSVRDVFHRDHDAMGVEPGFVDVRVLADTAVDPTEVVFVVRPGGS
ncbi:hypothetical protein [Nocardioides scoriae]|uniref:hypothetical protein n=1 Tax=Nocardioides scoriae TaxID=642780 RepID=UPI000B83A04D|nr:hypothetical protein [Nocardioides scoriae]